MVNKTEYDASLDASMENRNSTEQLREGSDIIKVGGKETTKITGYKFNILIKDKPSLSGIISREDMELIYKLYSSEGSNLTQRTVSRYFPNYTFQEFKRILRAFSITKASSPLAPHIIEESSTEKLIQLTIQQKENNYLKKLEQDRNKLTELKYKNLIKDHQDLKDKFTDISSFISNLDYTPYTIKEDFDTESRKDSRKLIINISDLHVGAKVSSYSLYDNEYDAEEIYSRFTEILRKISKIKDQFDKIYVFNLGDSLDGYNAETTRGGHRLEQNLDNKEQVKVFINTMTFFFDHLRAINNNITYVCVGESNHDGVFGWLANHKLASKLEYQMNITTYISDKFITNIKIDDLNILLCHGKDDKDMFRNLPLYIDDKTENKINEYLDYNNIKGKVLFIKGDLHQSALSYAKKFTYWSVGSIFGSSSWIQKNFGNTKASCDYGIYSNGDLFTSRIVLN